MSDSVSIEKIVYICGTRTVAPVGPDSPSVLSYLIITDRRNGIGTRGEGAPESVANMARSMATDGYTIVLGKSQKRSDPLTEAEKALFAGIETHECSRNTARV